MDDIQAIRQLKDGDIGGLEMLVARYQVKAVRIASFITYDQALAEEVVQETFVRLHRRIQQFDVTRPFEPYLLRSVVNAALNAARQEKRSLSLNSDMAAVAAMLDQAPPVEAQVEFGQMKREITRALTRLSPRQRAVIVQRMDETGEIFGERVLTEFREAERGCGLPLEVFGLQARGHLMRLSFIRVGHHPHLASPIKGEGHEMKRL